MNKSLFFAFILTALSCAMEANAQTSNLKRGGFCGGVLQSNDSTLICDHIGKVTIQQIYEKGFRVVAALSYAPSPGWARIVIEEQ